MYKNILLAIIIAIITGCSAPKPEQAPSWYTNIPQDDKLFYAVGAADTIDKAKNNAIASMRENLAEQIDNSFKEVTHKLLPIDNTILQNIFKQNLDISKKLFFKNITLANSQSFKGEKLVLISISKQDLFKKLKIISDAQFLRTKQEYAVTRNSATLKRFIVLDELMEKFAHIASLAEYKTFLLSTYNSDDEFEFLKNMKNEYDRLKASINIYVLTDSNSRIFSKIIKNSLNEKGLSTKNSFENEVSLKLLITSETTQSQEYSFNQSKSLVKFTLFDKQKTLLSLRQHTFIGKSRKSYEDAKIQSAVYLKNKINKLGIFDFIGIEK
ncbi:MAG: LPP20 family lipoprotein [Sulfurimonas sp.]|uniref:LPP20 family lipoprotein n=1 Tax=Sulfurimonas sp. TaxID=2022749 RepID=UPI002610CCAF|nr:LPP20 family lipoprotein [Sulfurimonas sp.]MCW8894682.1 LPP20 family lipoprotein [Sulfurimonas sp.]MCW8953607.1 LPP20 family lipoprotein [Sulfurimonas sp.]